MNCKIAQNDAILIESLLTSRTIKEAAESAGVSLRTVYYRLADPEFQQLFQALKKEQVQAISSGLNRLAQIALLEVEEIMTNPKTSTKDRLAAARIVLNAHYCRQ